MRSITELNAVKLSSWFPPQKIYQYLTMGGRTILVALLMLLVVLQYALWMGRHNLFDLFYLQDQLSQLEHENANLRKRNDRLHAEVIDIKSRVSAIEEKARFELGLIKQGETFFRIVPE